MPIRWIAWTLLGRGEHPQHDQPFQHHVRPARAGLRDVAAGAMIKRIETVLRVAAGDGRGDARALNPASRGSPPPLRGGG